MSRASLKALCARQRSSPGPPGPPDNCSIISWLEKPSPVMRPIAEYSSARS